MQQESERVRALAGLIADTNAQWNERIDAMELLGSVARDGLDTETEEFAKDVGVVLWALADTMGDTKPAVVRAAVGALGVLTSSLSNSKAIARPMAEGVLPALAKACGSTSGALVVQAQERLLQVARDCRH